MELFHVFFFLLFFASCVAFRFVLFVVLICFRFGFLQIFLPFALRVAPCRAAPPRLCCANKTRTGEQAALTACLPRPPLLALLLACLTALAAFHLSLRLSLLSLSRAAFALSYSEIKAKKGTRRRRR